MSGRRLNLRGFFLCWPRRTGDGQRAVLPPAPVPSPHCGFHNECPGPPQCYGTDENGLVSPSDLRRERDQAREDALNLSKQVDDLARQLGEHRAALGRPL